MNARTIMFTAAAAVAALATVFAPAQQTKPAQPPTPADEAARQMAQAIEMSKPVEEHARLAPLAGNWNISGQWTMPGVDPVEYKGTGVNKWILGNRFMDCSAVTTDGTMAMESRTTLGFDRRTNEYFAIGIDTLGTYHVDPRGQWDEATKTLRLKGEMMEPTVGKMNYEMVLKVEGPDRHTISWIMSLPGQEPMAVAETVFERNEIVEEAGAEGAPAEPR